MSQPFIYNKEAVEKAFKKLQANVYFDKNDLFNRAKIAELRTVQENSFDAYFQSLSNRIKKGPTFFNEYIDKIQLRFMPKSIEPDKAIETSKNFYTNEHLIEKSKVENLSLFIDVPIELHIICVLWLTKYGCGIDGALKKHNYGNRLFLNQNNELGEGRTLFKPYQEQYQMWWSKAVDKTKELLDSKDDATILNFDLKSFFHTIRFDFRQLEKFILELNRSETFYDVSDIETDCVHKVLKQIHLKYKSLVDDVNFKYTSTSGENAIPLPIGLLTSHVIANFYLMDFDKHVIEELNPIYYGRYVDDVLIVLKDRMLHLKDIKKGKKPNENSNEQKIENDITNIFFEKYLGNVFVRDSSTEYHVNIDKELLKSYTDLVLQPAKIFIYQFNHNMSPNLLSKFVKDQEKRSYIFQFLSDESDDMFNEFEIDAFEDSLDENDINKSKFRAQEINKFRFSVFMAKLIKRRMLNSGDYKKEEIDKISKYFKGIYCLKNFHFWEKLFTLYIVANEKQKFFSLLESILTAIKGLDLEIGDEIDFKNKKQKSSKLAGFIESEIKNNLKSHLEFSLSMALGLNPNFLNDKPETTGLNIKSDLHKKYITEIFGSGIELGKADSLVALNEKLWFFRKTSLLRHSYVFYPLAQYLDFVKEGKEPLYESGLFKHSVKIDRAKFEIKNPDLIPYRVKFYEAALFTIYKEIYTKSDAKCVNCKRWYQNEVLISSKYLVDAFELFKLINAAIHSSLLTEYFKSNFEDGFTNELDQSKCGELYSKHRTKNFLVHQLFLKNGGEKREKFRVAMINKYVPLSDYEASLEGNPIINEKRVQTYLGIIDEIKKVKDCDMFVMPELSLPHDLLPTFVSKSAHNQVGFIAGIEHWKASNIGYNFVFTNLPITVEGDRDAIPVIRLKNHYAPIEEDWINGKHMVVPKPMPYRYDLFIWRGVYFSTYYCYELADVFHRYALNGKIDIVFAPIWNADMHYYNNIAEVTTRDMHINLVQVNTSQYGESRVIRPTDFDRKDKARIKGGTVNDYDITISVSDIELKKFRDFQTKNFNTQKQSGLYKPTPPDFPIEDVIVRIKNKEYNWSNINFNKSLKDI